MKSLIIVLFLTAVLLISVAASSSSASGNPAPSFSNFKYSPNGIANFSANIDGKTIDIFRYFNVSSSSLASNMPFIGNDKLNSLYWHGLGNVTIIPALTFSPVGRFTFQSSTIEYVYFYDSSYLGILLTTGEMEEEEGQISISSGLTGGIEVSYVTSPLSLYNVSENSYTQSGNSYSGTYSSFSYYSGEILNYSLVKNYSSVSVISKMGVQNSSGYPLSMNMSGVADSGSSAMFASDSLFPLLYISGFNSSSSVQLTDAFHFINSGSAMLERGALIDPPLRQLIISLYREQVFRINSGNTTLGYADVYGGFTGNASSLSFTSPIYFATLRFLPAIPAVNAPMQYYSTLKNASSEIFVSSHAYFIPLSPNVTYRTLTFGNDSLNFQFLQNGSVTIVVVLEGRYSISAFSLSGSEGNSSNYTLERTPNETIISFESTGSGQKVLTLSVSPIANGPFTLPLIVLVVSSTAIVAVSLSLIFYSRSRWLKNLEKE
jgi:hypothetical protein